jgi:hypothetical protein
MTKHIWSRQNLRYLERVLSTYLGNWFAVPLFGVVFEEGMLMVPRLDCFIYMDSQSGWFCSCIQVINIHYVDVITIHLLMWHGF